ncbi:uncharacterized protein N7503_007903, partial [Penicillium pulvis]|uniref:uncharacterized protein n=1 Tax=Penicillium pulvis TaxID=1562058 RepID=UPI00254855EB
AIYGIGIGKPIWVLPRDERRRIALVNPCNLGTLEVTYADWVLQKCWPPAQVFIKVSIVLFLRRLLDCLEYFRQLAIAMIVLVIIWGTTAIIGNTFQCWPVQYYWIKHMSGHCMKGQDTFFFVIGTLSVLGNVLVLCLPLPIKIEITLLFSIRCLVCVFSIFRLVALRHFQTEDLTGWFTYYPTKSIVHSHDPSIADSAMTLIWTILELDNAIICGSLLLMKPLFQLWMGNARSKISRVSRAQSKSTEVTMVEESHHGSGPSQTGVRSPSLFVEDQVQGADQLDV